MLRELALTRLGKYGDEETVTEARKRFENHVSGKVPLPADLKGPVSNGYINIDTVKSSTCTYISFYILKIKMSIKFNMKRLCYKIHVHV